MDHVLFPYSRLITSLLCLLGGMLCATGASSATLLARTVVITPSSPRLTFVTAAGGFAVYHCQHAHSTSCSRLRALHLNRKRRHRHLIHLRHHTRLNAQPHQRTPHHTPGKRDMQPRPGKHLFTRFCSCTSIYAHPTQRLEPRVGQDEDAAVVRFEVVDRFAVE